MDVQTTRPPEKPTVVLRLYVVGDSPKSLQARANLERICKERLHNHYEIHVIDVLDDPLQMLADGITLTPALVKVSPPPIVKLFGDLGDQDKVVSVLEKTSFAAQTSSAASRLRLQS